MIVRALLAVAVCFALFPAPASSKQADDPFSSPAPQMGPQLGPQPKANADPEQDRLLRRAQKQRAAERQKQIKKDTDQLLLLATQLKQYVDKTNENILSLDVVRKAEEIEKLAKKVKTNMRDSMQYPGLR